MARVSCGAPPMTPNKRERGTALAMKTKFPSSLQHQIVDEQGYCQKSTKFVHEQGRCRQIYIYIYMLITDMSMYESFNMIL